jgi:transposase
MVFDCIASHRRRDSASTTAPKTPRSPKTRGPASVLDIMYRYITRQIKELIIIGLGEGLTAKHAAHVFCCSVRTVRRVRQNYREYGSVVPPRQAPSGRPRVFDRQAVDYLLEVLSAQPDIFLDELQVIVTVPVSPELSIRVERRRTQIEEY